MTRKRFIKLCMAKGWARNDANLLASRIHFAKTYERIYNVVLFTYAVQMTGRMIENEVCSMAENLRSALEQAMQEGRV